MSESEALDPWRYAPKGKKWVCAACGKESPNWDRHDLWGPDGGDESCVLNAVLVEIER